jgi:ribosomal protein L7/L12
MDPVLILAIIAAILIPLGLTWLSNRSKRESASTKFVRAKPISGAAPDILTQVRALMNQNNKIEAVKVLRAATGMGLAEAKAAVEKLDEGGSLDGFSPTAPAPAEVPEDLAATVQGLLQRGEKIEAIKLVRERMKLGLKEAKELVDKFE